MPSVAQLLCPEIQPTPPPATPAALQFAALVLLGAAHGLILLPVLLAAFGPEELEVGRQVDVLLMQGALGCMFASR